MKIPPKLRIKSRLSYEVLFSDVIKDDPSCYGISDPIKHQIILKNGQSEQEQLKSLIHEVIHCWENEYEIDIPHKSVYKLEEAIFKFLKLNRLI